MNIKTTPDQYRSWVIFLCLAVCTACDQASDQTTISNENVVNIYNWSDYVAPDTISNFETETGIKVNYDMYDSTYIVDTKLLAGNTGYDVIMHSGQSSTRLIPAGVYQPLDKKRLTHWQDQDEDVLRLSAAYTGTSEYSAIYTWGTTGFAYNYDMVMERVPNAPLESAAMLFDPEVVSKLADCGVSFLDEADDIFPVAMSYLGREPDSTAPEDIAAVEELFRNIRPYIRYFSSAKMISDLPNKEICVAMSWSGDYAQAAARAEEAGIPIDLRYTVPSEGSRLWFDGMYIPADAPHLGNAYIFMNYIMRPKVIADISNYVYYANGMVSSKPLLAPEVINNPGIYPTPKVFERLFVAKVLPLKEDRIRNRAWARIKSGL